MKLSTLNGWRRTALGIGALVCTLLASCGGGEQASSYFATRVLAFGDESSVINADRSKYTVNALSSSGTTTSLDCTANPIWIQAVAAIYGLTFPQCPSDTAVTDSVSHIYATNEAKVADLSTQIDTHLGTGDSFISGDLVTVLLGTNDIVAQFKTYDGTNETDLLANVEAAGAELADQVNRIATLGGKVIVSTIPDMGRTPFAGDRTDATNPNPGVLSRLSTRFNDALLSNLINDGHKIGLVQLDQYLIAVDNATQAGVTTSFANTTQAACLPSIPLVNCTTNTLQPDAVNSTWLWADDRHLGPSGQTSLGSLAVTRAQNNPF